jgi:hypothetical protein
MILQVHTEKELIGLVESLKKEVEQLRIQNKPDIKTLSSHDVSELITKHVTIDFVNKLYKKGK